ncbi:PREDICTED: uncharacterized protein LOC109582471 isoform X1 [Amphimedon queenslandica]|uniref:VPS9 domain-containing protein n=1 Tax=Amphimedon queenslandica TaxID=400682 RepID=A0AAN0J7M2_AMPQE|nr:PREDICTED: uncharacterized protein LOC109582471 isoform X1 [Amphimedon queenslandica]|eukprot:XP_019852747.1 PREDICTED: uncharacterized protein LOC109582471 isoform X1 [Amphimedon queenslandica]
MATNVQFMSEYGNPQLSIAEAGYYLTTLSAAISYIKTLSAEKLQKQEEINSQFVLCEIDALNWSASQCGIFMEVVSQKELVGYAPAVVKKWVLDKSRPFSTVLVETSDSSDKVQVAIVRFSSKKLSSKHAEYFYDILTNFDVHGICCRSSEDGCVVVADPKICGEELIILNSRNILEQLETLRYSIQLIRLGSQVPEDDEEYPPIRSSVPVSAVANSLSYLTSKQHDRSGKGRRDNSALLSCHVDYDTYRLSKERTKEFVVTAEVHHLEVDSETDCGKKKMVQNHCKNLTGKDDESSTVFTCDIVYLEQNYRENHMYGNQSGSVKESSLQLTKQCQMMLQKLSFLSHIHCLDGQYDDDTMNAVQSFQIAHNQQDDFSSIQLPENGYLSIATLQYLRQELLTVFANLMRLRKNVGLDVLTSFDPMSIDPDDMKKFFNFIVSFQKKVKIPQTGTLCTKTIFHIKRLLQVQQTFSFRGNSF